MKFDDKTRRILLYLIILAVVSLGVVVVSVAGWEYTNSDTFCTSICHSVHPEEAYSHKASRHANVGCVECHLGRLPVYKAVAVKSTHISHGVAMIVGYERPLSSPSMRTSKNSCEQCHSSDPHQNNTMRVRKTYAADETSTEIRTYLVLRNVGGAILEDVGRGLAWHTENKVRFIATDPEKQSIPWIEVTRPDQSTVVYTDAEAPLENQEVVAAKKHVMDCLNCHNRMGHPFPDPEAELDRALAEGKLSRDLPFAKARLQELLTKDFATRQDALRLTDEAVEQYLLDFPDVVDQHPEAFATLKKFVEERQQFVADLLVRSKFETVGLTWRSFPDNMGHRDLQGCFRCHDGRHVDSEGNSISRRCTLCHNVPIVDREAGPTPEFRNPFGLTFPSNHRDEGFQTDHPDLADESCESCHGEAEWGTEDISFCSNSTCHERDW